MRKKILIILGMIMTGVVLMFVWRGIRFQYEVCQSEISGEKICMIKKCKIDTCRSDFYDKEGNLIEQWEDGMVFRAPFEAQEPKTKVKNCQENLLPINWCKMPF